MKTSDTENAKKTMKKRFSKPQTIPGLILIINDKNHYPYTVHIQRKLVKVFASHFTITILSIWHSSIT